MHVSVSSFKPEQPGPFVHDLVLLLVPLPQVLEHLLHVLHGCHSDNGKIQRKQPFVKIALCCSCSSGSVCEILICNSVFQTKLLFRNGTGLFGLADLGWPFGSEPVRYDQFWFVVSVWRDFRHDISANKQLISFVDFNNYAGRRNVMVSGVMPNPSLGVTIAIKYEF